MSLGHAYFKGVLADVLPEYESLRRVFRLHTQGELVDAFEAGEGVDPKLIQDEKLRSLFISDHLLLAVKIGKGLLPNNPKVVMADVDARCVQEYAKFSYYFWNDHNIAWRSLWALLLLAPRSACPSLSLTVLFLMGHMLCIRGSTLLGFPVAAGAYHLVTWLKRGKSADFQSNIIFAAFPYTLFVAARLQKLHEVVRTSGAKLGKDSYYQNVFQVSSLYAHAYSADIAQTELYAHNFRRLQEQERLLRYAPLSGIMPLLPLALRGYSDLVREPFEGILSRHQPDAADTVINAQFYRAAALIALCLDQRDRALTLINSAIDYRKLSKSFQAWNGIDERIKKAALSSSSFVPGVDEIVKLQVPAVPPRLAGAFMQIIATSQTGVIDPLGFAQQVHEILCKHFGCEGIILPQSQSETLDPRVPALRFGDHFLVFSPQPMFLADSIWAMINAISPSIRTLETSVSSTRSMLQRLQDAERQAAAARMTEMLAHDVRKPFAMLKIGLSLLGDAKDTESMQRIVNRLVPEMNRAIGSVDGLIADVMEVGAPKSELILESLNIGSLLDASIEEVVCLYPNSAIEIRKNLHHMHCLLVNERKVVRVMANILDNAFQATGGSGHIWIETREQGPFVQFCIGNEGSFIAETDLSRVFDAFFTSGKKGGTGIGLAIAQKLVQAHGGKIWCKSSRGNLAPEGVVEFFFTLPICVAALDSPKTAKAIRM